MYEPNRLFLFPHADILTVDLGGMAINTTHPGDVILSGLPVTVTITATLMRSANSPGASGYLIMYGGESRIYLSKGTKTLKSGSFLIKDETE